MFYSTRETPESQPQNPEFRIIPENFRPLILSLVMLIPDLSFFETV